MTSLNAGAVIEAIIMAAILILALICYAIFATRRDLYHTEIRLRETADRRLPNNLPSRFAQLDTTKLEMRRLEMSLAMARTLAGTRLLACLVGAFLSLFGVLWLYSQPYLLGRTPVPYRVTSANPTNVGDGRLLCADIRQISPRLHLCEAACHANLPLRPSLVTRAPRRDNS
jgi:hypothetical protein